METLRPHYVTFALPDHLRPKISAWLSEVQSFFAKAAKLESDKDPHLSAESSAFPKIERNPLQGIDVLEGITVQYAVQLATSLGHHADLVRTGSAKLLFNLGIVFDEKLREKSLDLDKLLPRLILDDFGPFFSVGELFRFIGASLNDMSLAFVAGLENFYNNSDYVVRGICVSACARLISENQKVFLEEDNLAAIWNLYFLLMSLPLISKIYPDRLVIVEAFGVLAPLYTQVDIGLTMKVIESLMKLQGKTAKEVAAIKSALLIIFTKLAPSTSISIIDPRKEGSVYQTLVNLLNPSDEYAYDLLAWAVEAYTKSTTLTMTTSAIQDIVNGTQPQIEFIKSLSNHFRANPSLVRYGACMCLHTALKLNPEILPHLQNIWDFIITGVLDTDYLSSFLYMSIVDGLNLKVKDSAKSYISDMVKQLRHMEFDAGNYDVRYGSSEVVSEGLMSVPLILDAAIKYANPLPMKTLNKMMNSLEYMNKSQRIRQLELVRLWCSRVEKFDTFLMQSLIPLLDVPDEATQLATVRVILAMVSNFQNASPADVSFAWSYFKMMLNIRVGVTLLKAILNLVSKFPVEKLSNPARKELLHATFRLIFVSDPEVRSLTYELFATCIARWRLNLVGDQEGDDTLSSTQLVNSASAMLILSLGDQNVACVKKVIDNLLSTQNSSTKQLFGPLEKLREVISSRSLLRIVKCYDEVASTIIEHKEDFASLVGAIRQEEIVDQFWSFFLHDVPENQLARPDDYSYARLFVHSPFWVSLLLSKIGMPPPSIQIDVRVPRFDMPGTPAGRRRFICGFMLCTLPAAGIPDPSLRKAACVALLRCCITGTSVNPDMLKGLLEYATQQMLTHKQWTYLASAIDIFRMLLRMKISNLSQAMFGQYIDLALESAANSSSATVRLGALEFLETSILVFPSAVSMKLSEIRDSIRSMLVDKELQVSKYACHIYPLVFRCAANASVEEFYQYLLSEIALVVREGVEAAADPLLSSLSSYERERVLRCSIISLSGFRGSEYNFKIVQNTMHFLKHRNSSIRQAALYTVLNQMKLLHGHDKTALGWIVLPLFADPNRAVHETFINHLNGVPTEFEQLLASLPAHPDDAYLLSPVNWEELLVTGAKIQIISKNLNDMMYDLDALRPLSKPVKMTDADATLHLPAVSEHLGRRLKELVTVLGGVLPQDRSAEVMYFLQELQQNMTMQGPAILVLAEFSVMHPFAFESIAEVLLNGLAQEITPENSSLIEACIFGLHSVCSSSVDKFKLLVQKMIARSTINEGDLMALYYLLDSLKDIQPSKITDLLRKFMPAIGNQRHTLKKRLFAIYVSVELAAVLGADEMARVLDAVQTFLDSLIDEEDYENKVYSCLGRILEHLGPKHSLFKTLISTAKKNLLLPDSSMRLRSLHIIQIFARYLTTEDLVGFLILYLADPSKIVQLKAQESLALEGAFEFISTELQISIGKKHAGTRSGNQQDTENSELTAKTLHDRTGRLLLLDNDPFNGLYYKSDFRIRLTARYGLAEAHFEAHVAPPTAGILRVIDSRSSAPRTSEVLVSKYAWMKSIDPSLILHECMKKFPEAVTGIIGSLMADLNRCFEDKDNTDDDDKNSDELIESDLHTLSVLSNILLALDGISDRVPDYMDNLKTFIQQCMSEAQMIRESLYKNLESSFFFFNEYVDVPIVSDEQFAALEEYKMAVQDATQDIMKMGNAETFLYTDAKRNEMNDVVDVKSERLRRLTILACQATRGCGLYYASADSYESESLLQSFQFLASMLDNEHRGIRSTAVETLVSITKARLENNQITASDKAGFLNKVHEVVSGFLKRFAEDAKSLFRRKADMLILMAKLILHLSSRELKMDVITLLVKMWRDPDSEVRIVSIKMMLTLAEAKTAEVLECFGQQSLNAKRKGPSTLVIPDLMHEISSLISNEQFSEKENLNKLLHWYFGIQGTAAAIHPALQTA